MYTHLFNCVYLYYNCEETVCSAVSISENLIVKLHYPGTL